MPELPEVEAARRLLDAHRGQRIRDCHVVDASLVKVRPSTRPDAALLGGAQRIAALRGIAGPAHRHGKRLVWQLDDTCLVVHLGMTGRFVAGDAPRFVRWSVQLDEALHFDDVRRFGQVRFAGDDWAADLGPDALALPVGGLRRALGTRGRLKDALLDQRRVAGIGNIHAVEACWRAALHPDRVCGSLSDDDWFRLDHAVHAQLDEAIASLDPRRLVYYQDGGDADFAVYDRHGQPCRRCGAVIARTVTAGRSTYACPGCQS